MIWNRVPATAPMTAPFTVRFLRRWWSPASADIALKNRIPVNNNGIKPLCFEGLNISRFLPFRGTVMGPLAHDGRTRLHIKSRARGGPSSQVSSFPEVEKRKGSLRPENRPVPGTALSGFKAGRHREPRQV